MGVKSRLMMISQNTNVQQQWSVNAWQHKPEVPKQAVAHRSTMSDLSCLAKACASECASSTLWATAAPASVEAVATGRVSHSGLARPFATGTAYDNEGIADDTELGDCGERVLALLARIRASEPMVDIKGNSSKLVDEPDSAQSCMAAQLGKKVRFDDTVL